MKRILVEISKNLEKPRKLWVYEKLGKTWKNLENFGNIWKNLKNKNKINNKI